MVRQASSGVTAPEPPRIRPHEPVAEAAEPIRRVGWFHQTLNVLGKRRRFLLDTRSQLRASLLTVAVSLVLLVLLNLSLHAARERNSMAILADSPELTEMLQAQNRLEFILVGFASFVFLAGVFVVTVLETHKTAGAAFNLGRHMHAIQRGRYNTRLHLRRGDNLLELETSFNEMSRTLAERTWEDVESLESMAATCEKLAGPDEAQQLADALRHRAASKRRFVEPA